MPHQQRHVVEAPDGSVQIIVCTAEDGTLKHTLQMLKTLFELSRDGSDMITHFPKPFLSNIEDAGPTLAEVAFAGAFAVQMEADLALGILGHRPITQTTVDVSMIPIDRSLRHLWRLQGGQVVPVNP